MFWTSWTSLKAFKNSASERFSLPSEATCQIYKVRGHRRAYLGDDVSSNVALVKEAGDLSLIEETLVVLVDEAEEQAAVALLLRSGFPNLWLRDETTRKHIQEERPQDSTLGEEACRAYQVWAPCRDEEACQDEEAYQDEEACQDEAPCRGEEAYQDEAPCQGEGACRDEEAYQVGAPCRDEEACRVWVPCRDEEACQGEEAYRDGEAYRDEGACRDEEAYQACRGVEAWAYRV